MTRMTAPEERYRLRKKDGGSGRKMGAREERYGLGKLKKRPSKQDGRSGS
jgi:hypothetical protein